MYRKFRTYERTQVQYRYYRKYTKTFSNQIITTSFAEMSKEHNLTYSEHLYMAHDIKEVTDFQSKSMDNSNINLFEFMPKPSSLNITKFYVYHIISKKDGVQPSDLNSQVCLIMIPSHSQIDLSLLMR